MNQSSTLDTADSVSATGISLKALASACNGELVGNPSTLITGVASLGKATPDDLAFLVDAKTVDAAEIATPGVLLLRAVDQEIYNGNRILVDDPYLAYARASVRCSPNQLKASRVCTMPRMLIRRQNWEKES